MWRRASIESVETSCPAMLARPAVGGSGGASAVSFAEQVERGLDGGTLDGILPEAAIEPADREPRLVYEPGHPLADAKGLVAYPRVDTATEMVSLMSATRAYDANVAAMNTARTLALKALEIGGGQ